MFDESSFSLSWFLIIHDVWAGRAAGACILNV